MHRGVLLHSDRFLGYVHVANKMPVFLSMEFITFHEIMLLVFIVIQVIFMCIIFHSFQS